MNYLFKIYLLLILAVVVSCNNKEQEHYLIESALKLEQQNKISLDDNIRLMVSLKNLVYDADINERCGYLQSSVRKFTDGADEFSVLVSDAIKTNSAKDATKLYNQYQATQTSYKFLMQRILDSFHIIGFDTTFKGFINLDEKTFIQKYLNGKDSIKTKLGLLFLQADVIWKEHHFLEIMIEILTPSYHFDPIMAIGNTDKIIYKRGEKMELTANLSRFAYMRIKYAIVDGKKIETTNGVFQYYRKITQKTGLHKLRFEVYATHHGLIEAYPAVVNYKVE